MNDNVQPSDTELIERIQWAIAQEYFSGDAVRKVREILAPVVPAEGLPDYDAETATEAEKWIYDQAFEAGHQAALDPDALDLDEIRDVLRILIEALGRIIAQEKQRPTRGRIEFEGAVVPLPDEREGDR